MAFVHLQVHVLNRTKMSEEQLTDNGGMDTYNTKFSQINHFNQLQLELKIKKI